VLGRHWIAAESPSGRINHKTMHAPAANASCSSRHIKRLPGYGQVNRNRQTLRQNGYKIEWLAGQAGLAFPRPLLARPSERRGERS